MSDFLESLESGKDNDEIKNLPFYKAVTKDDATKISYLQNLKDVLLEESQERTRTQRDNLMMYRGVSVKKHDRYRDRDRNFRRLNKLNKFVVNHLYDLTETKVSQMTRIKPSVEVLPTNDEWQDRASATVVKSLVKHLWYINNIDYIVQRMHRHARIFGESYAFCTWDETLGDLHPTYVEARDQGVKSITLPDGTTQDLSKPIKTGDVKYEIELPWRVLLQRKSCIEEVEYCIRVKMTPTAELKDDYADKKIPDANEIPVFDMESLEDRFLENHTPVFEIFHKKTDKLPEGKYIKFVDEAILEETDLPYTHGELPFIRLTDLDVPDVLNGVSRYETIGAIQGMYNNISTLIAKNIYLTAHAKWVMPRGAAKIEQLGNDNTVIQYQGPVAPQLIQQNGNAPEVFAFRDKLKEEMQVIYGSHGVSRGEIPKGITAASALQFLNELESERASTDIAKHGFLVRDLARMTIAVSGDYYDVDDGRMVRIVGENNKYLIRHFDTAHLHKTYDVRFDNSTGLPETKAAKFQRILDAMQRHPQMLSPERWEELLELGNVEKMHSLIAEAIKAADSENEDLLAGREVAMPEEWEDHVAHWESHVRAMQSRQIKEEADPVAVAKLKDHLYWTEEAMYDKAQFNPEFGAKLATLTNFPVFRHPGFQTPASREHSAALVQGQANRGSDVTAQIPGISKEDLAASEQALNSVK
jgi:hypothetical protein